MKAENKKKDLAKKLYNIKDRQRGKPMSEFMKEGRASTNAIRPTK